MSAIRWRKGVRNSVLLRRTRFGTRCPYLGDGCSPRPARPPRLPLFACRLRVSLSPPAYWPVRRVRLIRALPTNSVHFVRALPAFCHAYHSLRATSSTCAARALEHALPHRAYLRALDCAPPTQFPSAASRGGERASKAGAGEQEHFDSCSRARANCTPPSVASVLRYFNSRPRMRGNWKYAFPVVAI